MGEAVKNVCKEHGIIHSYRERDDHSFDNQVVERLNRKFWDTLKEHEFIKTQEGKRRVMKGQLSNKQLIIQMVIEKLNADKPRNWELGSPLELYEGLSSESDRLELMAKSNTPEGKWVHGFHLYVLMKAEAQEYAQTLSRSHESLTEVLEEADKSIKEKREFMFSDITWKERVAQEICYKLW